MDRQPFLLSVAFLSGLAVGAFSHLDEAVTRTWLESLLCALLLLIGISVADELTELMRGRALVGRAAKLLLSTVAGSALGGLLSGALLAWGEPLGESGCANVACAIKYGVAVSLGMGWYTFTGVLLSMRDSLLGFLGFTSNLLRELLTFVIYPLLPKRYRISGISIGGATTMDTTLPIIHRFGGPDAALLAFIHGAVLTLAIPILLPLVVGLV